MRIGAPARTPRPAFHTRFARLPSKWCRRALRNPKNAVPCTRTDWRNAAARCSALTRPPSTC
jgi:hypothetical protein